MNQAPTSERHAHHQRHASCTHIQRRGDEVQRTHQRTNAEQRNTDHPTGLRLDLRRARPTEGRSAAGSRSSRAVALLQLRKTPRA